VLLPLVALLLAPAGRAEAPTPPPADAPREPVEATGLRQRVALHVAFVDRAPTRVTATVQQDGARHALVLTDDGTDPADAAGDRVWSGSVLGTPAQYLPVAVTVETGGIAQEAWRGVVRGGLEASVEIGVEVTEAPDGTLVGRRRATTSPGGMAHAAEALPLLAVTAWGVLLLVGAAVAGTRVGAAPAIAEASAGRGAGRASRTVRTGAPAPDDTPPPSA
jgi:hypothetical protein